MRPPRASKHIKTIPDLHTRDDVLSDGSTTEGSRNWEKIKWEAIKDKYSHDIPEELEWQIFKHSEGIKANTKKLDETYKRFKRAFVLGLTISR